MIDIKKEKEEARKAWEPINAEWDEIDRKQREKRKLQRKCFWTYPWGHVAGIKKDAWSGNHCAVCDKWLR